MTYRLIHDSDVVLRIADGVFIPNDRSNKDRRNYLTWLSEGNTPEPAVIPPVTAEQVNIERDRRIDLPKSVGLSSGKSFRVDIANGGRMNVGDLGTAALAKQSVGDTSTIPFRDADNADWDLSNADIIEMGLQITAQISALHVAARAIKSLDPIPSDYAKDDYWP